MTTMATERFTLMAYTLTKPRKPIKAKTWRAPKHGAKIKSPVTVFVWENVGILKLS